jgi:acetyl-CoA synthetase
VRGPIVPVGTSYDEVRSRFRWSIPATFNIGSACSDEQPPHAVALIEYDPRGAHRARTFGELADASNRLANALPQLGVERGARVALLLPQSFATATAHLAVCKADAVAVPLSELFGPDALRHRLEDSSAHVLIVAPDLVESVAELAAALEIVVIVDGDAVSPHLRLADLIGAGSPTAPGIETAADAPAFLIYTSGTTAAPKGVLHAQRALFGHLPGFELSHSFFPQEGDLFWTPADWAWIGGLMDALMPTLFLGRPIVAGPRGRFDPELAARVIVETGARNVFIPPTALRLMKGADVSLPTGLLRTVMSGGESLGADTLEWARGSLGVTVAEIYGQTEANYLVGNSPGVWPVRPGSMGLPYPGHDVGVIDAGGEPLPAGELGEVAVRVPDPVAFLAYLNAPEATAAKYVGHWLRTGDLATVDEDRYLWFKGRADDLIISAGYRISPLEVEHCLLQHPAVIAAAVIGVPDELRGQVVKAFVVARGSSGGPALGLELQQFVRRRLAAYEYPRQVEFVSELPLTVTGKIRRRALAEAGEDTGPP